MHHCSQLPCKQLNYWDIKCPRWKPTNSLLKQRFSSNPFVAGFRSVAPRPRIRWPWKVWSCQSTIHCHPRPSKSSNKKERDTLGTTSCSDFLEICQPFTKLFLQNHSFLLRSSTWIRSFGASKTPHLRYGQFLGMIIQLFFICSFTGNEYNNHCLMRIVQQS